MAVPVAATVVLCCRDVMSVFVPDAAAESDVRALAAVVAPVPPLATASVADNPAAVPVVFWFSVGTSDA